MNGGINNMLTRVIFSDGKVYYRVKDIKKHLGVSDYMLRKIIKVSEVETVKLEGFGNTSFIREEDISLLDINGGGMIMRTEYKDFQKSYETNESMDSFFNFMFSNKLPKKTPNELYIKTMDELDSFRDNAKHKKEDEYHMKRELFNELCKKYGYSERVVYARFVSRNEYFELPVIINGKGNIVDSTTALDYCYCCSEESLDYLRKDIKNGILTSDDGEIALTLTKGEPFTIPSEDYLLKQIFKLLSENEIEQSCVDWIDVKLQNGNQISIDMNMLIALMSDNIRIVVNEEDSNKYENKFKENENDIIDVDYNECL